MIYGYIRVSSKDQHTDRQRSAMEEYQIPEKQIFIDKQSGKDFNRPAYKRMMKKLRRGDILVVKSIDRLGRNYAEILEQWRILTKERGVDIRVIDMPLLNTEGEENGITRMFIADLVLQILAYVAQTEREFIRQRQREGIALAHERGVKFGRPHITVPDNFPEVYELWCEDLISGREAGRLLQVDLKTFKKWAVAERERIALEEKT